MGDPTVTAVDTVKAALDRANLNEIASLLRKLKLGTLLASEEYDTGTVSAADAITLPYEAALIQSVRVVTGGVGYTGVYLVADSGSTPAVPPTATAYAGAAFGLAKLGTDRKTITFPTSTQATRVVVRYSRMSAGMSDAPVTTTKA